MKSFVNDQLVDSTDARVSVYDLGLNRGYAVFDYFRIVGGRFRFLEDHLQRFVQSIQLSRMSCVYTIDQIRKKIVDLKEINEIVNGYVRITMTAGESADFANPSSHSNLIVVVGKSIIPESNAPNAGVNLISKKYQRPVPEIKTTNYFFAQMHKSEMLEANAVDILYYDRCITETSRANIFFIKNNILFTPKSNILEGITRKKVLSMYGDTRIEDISMHQLPEFDEAFICSSTREITPILKIDDITIGSGYAGTKTKEVIQRFKAISMQ